MAFNVKMDYGPVQLKCDWLLFHRCLNIVALNIIAVDVSSERQHILGVGREDSDWWEMRRVGE